MCNQTSPFLPNISSVVFSTDPLTYLFTHSMEQDIFETLIVTNLVKV